MSYLKPQWERVIPLIWLDDAAKAFLQQPARVFSKRLITIPPGQMRQDGRTGNGVPGATLTQIEVGHMIVYTHPDIVADWILAQDAQREQMGRQND